MALAELLDDIDRMRHCFDFTDGRLAEDVAEATAVGIFEFMDAEVGPDGSPWIALSEAYAKWKAKHYPGRKMAELDLLMKDPAQLKGTLAVSRDQLVQTYGTVEEARLHAEWFQEGHTGQNRPPRPFYEFNDAAIQYLESVFDARFAAAIP